MTENIEKTIKLDEYGTHCLKTGLRERWLSRGFAVATFSVPALIISCPKLVNMVAKTSFPEMLKIISWNRANIF